MIPSTLESVILILAFFVPGYCYKVIKSKFKYDNWSDSKIVFVDLIFVSFIFQSVSWLFFEFALDTDVLFKLSNTITPTGKPYQVLQEVTYPTLVAILLASITAVIESLKPFRSLRTLLINKLSISKILDLGLDYGPPLNSVIEADSENKSRAIHCVIELKSGEFYEGNIKHVGFGKNDDDKLLVLSKITALISDRKKRYPDELSILIPYREVKSIIYKSIPVIAPLISNGDSKNNIFNPMSIISYSFLLIIGLILGYLGRYMLLNTTP